MTHLGRKPQFHKPRHCFGGNSRTPTPRCYAPRSQPPPSTERSTRRSSLIVTQQSTESTILAMHDAGASRRYADNKHRTSGSRQPQRRRRAAPMDFVRYMAE